MSELRLRVLVDHELVRELEVAAPLSIGRAADNDLVLGDEAVSSHHGRVERLESPGADGARWAYADAGSANGSLVAAGPRLGRDERVPLVEQTQILVGRTVLEFVPGARAVTDDATSLAGRRAAGAASGEGGGRPAAPDAPPPPVAVAAPAARVVVVDRDERRLVELQPPRVVVGRADDCELRVSCPSVSQHHAELRAHGEGWSVRDLGSTNGTRVGLVPVEGERRLASGSHLILGELDLLFIQEGAPPPAVEDQAFLDWLKRRHVLRRKQVRAARAALEAAPEGRSLDELLVHQGLVEPGRLTELRGQARAERRERAERAADDGAERRRARLLMLAALLGAFALLAWLASGG